MPVKKPGNFFQNIVLTEEIKYYEDNIYVQSVKLNGNSYNKKIISHQEIMKGGTLKFIMGCNPKH